MAPVVFTIPAGNLFSRSILLSYDSGHAQFRDGTALEGKVVENKMVLPIDKNRLYLVEVYVIYNSPAQCNLDDVPIGDAVGRQS
jgi:hypothetical protein